jgi:predicted phage-related endonuclease
VAAKTPRAEGELDEVAAGWLDLYRDTKAKIADLQETLILAEGKLREAVGGAEVVRYGGAVVISYPRFDVTRLDIARLRQERPDIVEAYSKTSEGSRFTVDPT